MFVVRILAVREAGGIFAPRPRCSYARIQAAYALPATAMTLAVIRTPRARVAYKCRARVAYTLAVAVA